MTQVIDGSLDVMKGMAVLVPSPYITIIDDAVTSHLPSTGGVRIGVEADYEFYMYNVETEAMDWVDFTGCLAGEYLPIIATGARVDGGAAPAAGAVNFYHTDKTKG